MPVGRRTIKSMNHSFISRKEDDMTTQHHLVITKILVSAAIALGSCVGLAAPAGADTNPFGTDPNPFGALTCSCQTPASVTSPDVMDQINRGIQDALTN